MNSCLMWLFSNTNFSQANWKKIPGDKLEGKLFSRVKTILNPRIFDKIYFLLSSSKEVTFRLLSLTKPSKVFLRQVDIKYSQFQFKYPVSQTVRQPINHVLNLLDRVSSNSQNKISKMSFLFGPRSASKTFKPKKNLPDEPHQANLMK